MLDNLVDDLQEFEFVGAAGVHDHGARVHGDVANGVIGVGVDDVAHGVALGRKQVLDRLVALSRVEGQGRAQQVADIDAADRERAQAGGVQPNDVGEDILVQAVDHDELAQQARPEPVPHELEGGGLLQRLAGSRQGEVAGVDDRATEERPIR